jgi:uncharacterized protein DUF998
MNTRNNHETCPLGEQALRTEHRPTGASLIAVIGIATAFVGVTIMHAVRPDVDPLKTVMSHYANGPEGSVMSVVFYAFGATALALGFRLRGAITLSGVTKAFPVLLWLAGTGLIAAGVYEVDPPIAPETIQDMIHSDSAVAAFVMIIVAMMLFTRATRHDERWRSVHRVSLSLAVTAAVAAAGTKVFGGTSYSGGIQRVLAGAVLAWFLVTALHIRRKSFDRS